MSYVAIRVENLSKRYRIVRREKYPTLREVLANKVAEPWERLRAWREYRAAGASLPVANNEFWALRDVSLDVDEGEIVGIIGHNGAGKSTLLKILSRITKPTMGSVKMRGRVGSLLEVGTGFHPELTGRENIYLNGAILGMKKNEIDRKLDEIVDFAEVEDFIYTPVKRYSTGMFMRLAFSVAAHLESELLIVDEVLAVGDAAFQKKCLGKMGQVAQEGRTVLFVSHNMDAIQRLCNYCLLLEKGRIVQEGSSQKVVSNYLSRHPEKIGPDQWTDLSANERRGTQKAYFKRITYSSHAERLANFPYPFGELEFTVKIISDAARAVDSMAVVMYSQSGMKLVNADIAAIGEVLHLKEGENVARIQIEELFLNPGIYVVGLWLGTTAGETLDHLDSACEIEVIPGDTMGLGVTPVSNGTVACRFQLITAGERSANRPD